MKASAIPLHRKGRCMCLIEEEKAKVREREKNVLVPEGTPCAEKKKKRKQVIQATHLRRRERERRADVAACHAGERKCHFV